MRVSPRERPARPPLSHEAVLQAGLRVLREQGIDGVTMRRVAAELDTGPASLYVYVHNRQDLLDQMFDHVAGTLELEPVDPPRWREQLIAVLTAVRDAMDAHPGIARVPLANVPTGPNAMRVADHVLALLRAGGIPDASAAWAVDVVFLYVNAAAYETSLYVQDSRQEEDLVEEIRSTFATIDAERFPNMHALSAQLVSGDGDERFQFGLQLMINGLLHTPPPQ